MNESKYASQYTPKQAAFIKRQTAKAESIARYEAKVASGEIKPRAYKPNVKKAYDKVANQESIDRYNAKVASGEVAARAYPDNGGVAISRAEPSPSIVADVTQEFISTPSTHAYRMADKAASMSRYHAKVAMGTIVTEAARRAKMVEDAKEDAHIMAQADYWYPEYN